MALPAGKKRADAPSEKAVSGKWAAAAGLIGWLAGVLAPAIAFNTNVAYDSSLGPAYQAFFQILTTVLFLLAWRQLDRLPLWSFGVLAAVAIALFVTYTLLREGWTCLYFDEVWLVRGSDFLEAARKHLAEVDLLQSRECELQLSEYQGDSFSLWDSTTVTLRFLALFSLYSLSWLSLAILVVGAARYGAEKVAKG